jgi:hypothetical protein
MATMAYGDIDVWILVAGSIEESGVDEPGDSIRAAACRHQIHRGSVRRSSSLMPTPSPALPDARPRPSDPPEEIDGERPSSGPCIFGFDYVHRGGT